MYAKKITQSEELTITLHSGDVYLGSVGHPDYASRDIIGETVNLPFLMMNWVAKNCTNGIGFTQNVMDHLTEDYPLVKHDNIHIDLIKRRIPIFEVGNKPKIKRG